MDDPIRIDPDVRAARTLPAACYANPHFFGVLRDRVLARAWHPAPAERLAAAPGAVHPFRLGPGMADEPLVLTRPDEGEIRCLSNVCTHRGNLVVLDPGVSRGLLCGYHRRAFDLDGRCLGQAQAGPECWPGFPGDEDHLPAFPLHAAGPLAFTALDPALAFDAWSAPLRDLLPAGAASWRFDPGRSPVYEIDASWMLYVENYLEGLHIASVHPELDAAIDRDTYRTDVRSHAVLQTTRAADGADDAQYLWLWPNLMINRYAWGLSVNVVEPIGPARTRVRYLAFVGDDERLDDGPGGALPLVERQDQQVVEQVQQGLRSRAYTRGRYVPGWEEGVHHFHRLIADAWNASLTSA